MAPPGDAGAVPVFKDFIHDREFTGRAEFNEHVALERRSHKVHGPCEICGIQLHITGTIRANKKTGVPKLFCEPCKADLAADLGVSP